MLQKKCYVVKYPFLVEPLWKNLTKFQNNATNLLVNHAFLDADMTRKIDF